MPRAMPGLRRHHGIDSRPRVQRPGLRHFDDVGAVDLIGRRERLRRQPDQGEGATAVLGDIGRLVVRAVAAIERGIDAGADAALAREEAVADARAISQRFGLDHRAGGSSKSGRCGQGRHGDRQRLEQSAHLLQVEQALGGRVEVRRLRRRGAAGERGGAQLDAQALEQRVLGDGTVHRGPGLAGGPRQRAEIDMGGQIGGTGIDQHAVLQVAADGLQAVAAAAAIVAVVDDQRGAAMLCDAAADRGRQRDAGRTGLDDHALARRLRRRGRHGQGSARRAQREDEAVAAAVDIDDTFEPAAALELELMNRQGVEQLVGDEQERTIGNVVEGIVPGRRDLRRGLLQRLGLTAAQIGTGLDHVQIDGGVEARHLARAPQRVGHQRAAPRTQLDQANGSRPAHRFPDRGAPGAQQLAEHLADLRRGDEIALQAEGIALLVVAVLRMAERFGHVFGDGDRPGDANAPGQKFAQRRSWRVRSLGGLRLGAKRAPDEIAAGDQHRQRQPLAHGRAHR